MRRQVETTTAAFVGVLLALVLTGCSEDQADQGSGKCEEGQTYDSDAGACVDEGEGGGTASASGTGGDAVGGSDGATASGGSASGGSGDASTDPYAGGACEKRSKYVKIYEPIVYFTVDTSDSMTGDKWTQAKSALDTVADNVANDLRVGLSAYPQPSAGCSSKELLDLGRHGAGEIKNSYASIETHGGTPTGIALYQVRAGDWLSDPGDQYNQSRPKGVILITDGQPNDEKVCDQTVKDPIEQARKLANQGVEVYVVGYKADADPKTLNKLAQAGGTDAPGSERFYSASSGSELADKLLTIAGTSVSCSFSLNPAPPDGSTVNLTLGGESVPDSGYDYDESSARVSLTGNWCDKVRNQAEQGTTLNVDIGCPDCVLAGESCQSNSDCCDGNCENGVCVEQCRTLGETCASDGECCSEICATSSEEELLGECQGG